MNTLKKIFELVLITILYAVLFFLLFKGFEYIISELNYSVQQIIQDAIKLG